nr:hypothetical protein [Gammaproteobacteria bacterium]
MSRVLRTVSCLALGLALLSGNALAGARDELARFTRGLKGLEGEFTQQVYDANGRRKESSAGKVAVSAPRLFRWEYKKPFAQLIVADGQKVWVYEPDLQQATVKPQGEEVELIDQVRVERTDARGRPTILTTTRLTLFPEREYAQTRQAVRIVAANGVTTAQGMRAYLNDSRMILQSNVRGQHEVR